MPSRVHCRMSADTECLRTIYPDEVWLMVLAKVQSMDDYHRINRTCAHFGYLFHELRTKVLFMSVAKLLLHHEDQTNSDKNEILELLLKCRRVCSNWKSGVDSMFQDTSHHDPTHDQTTLPKWLTNLTPEFDLFEELTDFQKFHRHFEPTHLLVLEPKTNPFLFRSVRIPLFTPSANEQAVWLEYLQELVTTFNIFGKHIWFLSVRYAGQAKTLKVCQTMKRVLEHFPNLQVLKINYSVGVAHYRTLYDYDSDQADTANFLLWNPMPALAKLKVFKCDGALPLEILKSILSQRSNLTNSVHLTYLELGIRELPALDFLIPTRGSLKTLRLSFTGKLANYAIQELDRLDKNIKFYKHLKSLKTSNICEIFPALQEIKLENHVTHKQYLCTREKHIITSCKNKCEYYINILSNI